MIYAIGFIIAAVFYLGYVLNNGKSITALTLILAILFGLASWFGVIIMLIIVSLKKRE